ncbi:MAG TPA: isoprenylcysteine carboxylmethyltransferase family protein [Terriglobales bacterium]|nr:isoprenylcysteine carboxylmethyltransferase family protein [Terriglobales bacterium]
MTGWPTVARRIRVPLGFAFAVAYLWLARPSWLSIAVGGAMVAVGLALRGYASGHLVKATELTTTGPYAYTRNPLYFGSIVMATGFALAARSLWLAVAMVVMLAVIYVPVIRFEEEYMRAHFAEFAEYAGRVPRLWPRMMASGAGGRFSAELYLKHREYNALLGAAGVMAALVFKLVWFSR